MTLTEKRERGRYAVIYWCPFGIPGSYGAAQVPIGVMCADDSGAGAVGLVALSDLEPVADALGATQQRLSEIDRLLMNTIVECHLTPEQAHKEFPGLQRSCYQSWQVAKPQPLFMSMLPDEKLRALWTRLGGLPLHVTSWEGYPSVGKGGAQ